MKLLIEAFILGLSTGTYCTMYCGPVLIPFLFGADKIDFKNNAYLTGIFLTARLAMYFILGTALGMTGLFADKVFNPVIARHLSVFAYLFSGTALLLNSLGTRFPWHKNGCKCKKIKKFANDWVTAVFTGFSTGLHLCPPLWTAIVRSAFNPGGMEGKFYLIAFYAGSLPFFLPLLGIPFASKKFGILKSIARISQFLAGIYFTLFLGILPLFFN